MRTFVVVVVLAGAISVATAPVAHASSSWWRYQMQQGISAMNKKSINCVANTYLADAKDRAYHALPPAQRAQYDQSLYQFEYRALGLCEAEIATLWRWQPSVVPQVGLEAQYAREVTNDLRRLKASWLNALVASQVYLYDDTAADTPAGNFSDVVNAYHTENRLESQLQRWSPS